MGYDCKKKHIYTEPVLKEKPLEIIIFPFIYCGAAYYAICIDIENGTLIGIIGHNHFLRVTQKNSIDI